MKEECKSKIARVRNDGRWHSRGSDWSTPQELYNELDKEFHFTLDPCSTRENHKCKKYFTIDDDGLTKDWSNEIVFMNPPYKGQTPKWVQKAYEESLRGAVVVCLLSAGVNRSYWHNFIFPYAAQILWIKGCIKFEDSKSTAPFASALIVFDNDKEKYSQKYVWGYPSK